MSAGHREHNSGLDERKIEAILNDERVQKALRRIRRASINEIFEIPYTAGYSDDGKTLFIDKDLPKTVQISGNATNPRRFILLHEAVEKAVIDALDERYEVAHDVATYAERKAVEKAGISWRAYQDALEPFINADEREPIKDIPPDLDLTPYEDDPATKGMLRKMRQAQNA